MVKVSSLSRSLMLIASVMPLSPVRARVFRLCYSVWERGYSPAPMMAMRGWCLGAIVAWVLDGEWSCDGETKCEGDQRVAKGLNSSVRWLVVVVVVRV